MNIHTESRPPSSKTWTHAGAAEIKEKLRRQICSPGRTGRPLRLPISYLYAAKLLYMSKSRQPPCASSECKLLPGSSKSHQSDKPLLKVYQRG